MSEFRKRVASCLVVVLFTAVCIIFAVKTVEGANAVNIPSAMSEWEESSPSSGEVKLPVFMIDFKDVKYADTIVSGSKLDKLMFSENEKGSVTEFYKTASYNQLMIDGSVFIYTALGNIADYEVEDGFETLAMEVLNTFDDMIDYSKYDSDKDGYIDAFVLCVPTGGDADFWYGCQCTWYTNYTYEVDGVRPYNYIICDSQADENDMEYFYETVNHELAHCMGLPDYYKYTQDEDWEGLHGVAGMELMDDLSGDLSSFSKLQLGWLKKNQVFVHKLGKNKKYKIASSDKGGCIVIFPDKEVDFQSEYFIIEYNLPKGNFEKFLTIADAGVRIFHVDATDEFDGWYNYYKYNNYSDSYDSSNNGRRVVRLVNDGEGYYKTGDTVCYGENGLEWYDKDKNTKLEISIEELDDRYATIEVKSK